MFVLFLSISLKLTLVIYLFLVSFGSFNGKCIGTNYTQQLFTWFVSRAVHQDKNAKQKPQGRQSFNLVWPCLLSKKSLIIVSVQTVLIDYYIQFDSTKHLSYRQTRRTVCNETILTLILITDKDRPAIGHIYRILKSIFSVIVTVIWKFALQR